MTTPALSLLADAESTLISAMTTVPLALMVIAVVLRQVPRLTEWMIGLLLWGVAVVVGVAFADEPTAKHAIAAGFIQGSLATGVALLYAAGIRGFMKGSENE